MLQTSDGFSVDPYTCSDGSAVQDPLNNAKRLMLTATIILSLLFFLFPKVVSISMESMLGPLQTLGMWYRATKAARGVNRDELVWEVRNRGTCSRNFRRTVFSLQIGLLFRLDQPFS